MSETHDTRRLTLLGLAGLPLIERTPSWEAETEMI